MTDELEKTCENCKYDDEDMEGTHCRHCIHNATEHFEPKEVVLSEREIRAKAIDELVDTMKSEYYNKVGTQFDNAILEMEKIAARIKEGDT